MGSGVTSTMRRRTTPGSARTWEICGLRMKTSSLTSPLPPATSTTLYAGISADQPLDLDANGTAERPGASANLLRADANILPRKGSGERGLNDDDWTLGRNAIFSPNE